MPLLTGLGQGHHGEILRQAAELIDQDKLIPLMNEQRFAASDIAAAHTLVESGAVGKVIVEFANDSA